MRRQIPINKQGLVNNNKKSMVLIDKNQAIENMLCHAKKLKYCSIYKKITNKNAKSVLQPNMKRIALLFLFILCGFLSRAQLASNFHLSLGIQSKYMWRGIEYGTSPVLFPRLNYEYKGFYVYGMGGYATDGSHQEVDLGISYSIKGFTFSVNDYYYPTAVGKDDQYFNFKSKVTGHWFEGCIQYSPENLPFSILLSTYFAGADKQPTTHKHAWSSYLEVGGHYDFDEENIISLAIGAALNKSFYNDYAHNFCVCNIELKYAHTFAFKKITIPISASYIVNPLKEKSYVTFSAAFQY